MSIKDVLHPRNESEMVLMEEVRKVRSKLYDQLVKSPECGNGTEDHEYYALFDDTSVREDGDMFRLRGYLRHGSYVAVGMESSIEGNCTLVFPNGSRHAVVTDLPIAAINKDGFPVETKADVDVVRTFDREIVDRLIGAINGNGKGFVEGKWIQH